MQHASRCITWKINSGEEAFHSGFANMLAEAFGQAAGGWQLAVPSTVPRPSSRHIPAEKPHVAATREQLCDRLADLALAPTPEPVSDGIIQAIGKEPPTLGSRGEPDVLAMSCSSVLDASLSALVVLHALARAPPPAYVLPPPVLPPAEPIPPEPPPPEPPPVLPPPEPPPPEPPPPKPPPPAPHSPEPAPPLPEPPPPEPPPGPPLSSRLAARLRGGGKGPVGTASHLRTLNTVARLSSPLGVVRRSLGRPHSPPPPSPPPTYPLPPPASSPIPTTSDAPPEPMAAPLLVGTVVKLRGLRAKPELNGGFGEIWGELNGGRIPVRLPGDDAHETGPTILVKRENLAVLSATEFECIGGELTKCIVSSEWRDGRGPYLLPPPPPPPPPRQPPPPEPQMVPPASPPPPPSPPSQLPPTSSLPPQPPPPVPPPIYPVRVCRPSVEVLRSACAYLAAPPPAPLLPMPSAAENLMRRFPDVPQSHIMALLAKHGGHAGRAARVLAGRRVAPIAGQPAPAPASIAGELGTELREIEERIGITQDRIDGGSLTCPRAELLELRQQLRDRAERLQQSIARALETPPPQRSPPVPPAPSPLQPPEPMAASDHYEAFRVEDKDDEPEWLTTASELMEQQLGYAPRPARSPSSRSPSPVASLPDERLPRTHDRRGWRSRAPWRHADGVRSRWRRDECGGARCVGAPCIRIAYGEGMGRSRSGPASILSVVSPARPPTQ